MLHSVQNSCACAARFISNGATTILTTAQKPKVVAATAAVAAAALASYAYRDMFSSISQLAITNLTPALAAISSFTQSIPLLVGGCVLATAISIVSYFSVMKMTKKTIKLENLVSDVHAQTGQTYDSDGSGNIDYAYVNPRYNFAYVADGAGHNKPGVKPVQNKLFQQFNKDYATALETSNFNSMEDIKTCLGEQLTKLAKGVYEAKFTEKKHGVEVEKSMRDYSPAFSFAQIVKINGQNFLLRAQLGDCMLLARTPGGKFQPLTLNAEEMGDGAGIGHDRGRGNFVVPKVCTHKIASGCEVFGLSDGIGEYLTLEQLTKEIEKHTEREALLEALKEKVVSEGTKFDGDRSLSTREEQKEARYVPSELKPANGQKTLKYWMNESREFNDDLSLFSMKVNL